MSLISESRLRQVIREALKSVADEKEILSLGFDDISRGLEIAKKKAAGKQMSFVRDVGDLYVYAAIGGTLEAGPNYAPEMFVVIHDGARPDKKSLGAVFRPDDQPPKDDQFRPDYTKTPAGRPDTEAAEQAAQVLKAAYAGKNSYNFLVKSVREGVLTSGDASQVASAPAPVSASPPAAAATDAAASSAAVTSAAQGKKPTWLSKLFSGKRAERTPDDPQARAPARIATRVYNQLTGGSGVRIANGVETLHGNIQKKIASAMAASPAASEWFSKDPKVVLPDSLVINMTQRSVDKFIRDNSITDPQIVGVYEEMLSSYQEANKVRDARRKRS